MIEEIKSIAYWLKSRSEYDHWGIGKIGGVKEDGTAWIFQTTTTVQEDIDKLINEIENMAIRQPDDIDDMLHTHAPVEDWTASELFEYLYDKNIIETFEVFENWMHDRALMIEMVKEDIADNGITDDILMSVEKSKGKKIEIGSIASITIADDCPPYVIKAITKMLETLAKSETKIEAATKVAESAIVKSWKPNEDL